MLKKVYCVTIVTDENDNTLYRVTRNYKNGRSLYIGRAYKTADGARRQSKHRNSCHFDRYGTEFVRVGQ